MEALIYIGSAGFVLWMFWMNRRQEGGVPMRLRVLEDGTREPVCGVCGTRLMAAQRSRHSALSWMFIVLVLLWGLVSLVFYNALLGAVLLILALFSYASGGAKSTVMSCPSCGQDARKPLA